MSVPGRSLEAAASYVKLYLGHEAVKTANFCKVGLRPTAGEDIHLMVLANFDVGENVA